MGKKRKPAEKDPEKPWAGLKAPGLKKPKKRKSKPLPKMSEWWKEGVLDDRSPLEIKQDIKQEIKEELEDEAKGRTIGFDLPPHEEDLKAPVTREDLNNLKFYFTEMNKILQPAEINYVAAKQSLQQSLDMMDLQNMYMKQHLYKLAKNKLTTMHDPLMALVKTQEMNKVKENIVQMPNITKQLTLYTVETILDKLPPKRVRPTRKLLELTKHQLTWDVESGAVFLFGMGVHPHSNILSIIEYLQTSPKIRLSLTPPPGVDKVFEYILIKSFDDLIVRPIEEEAVMFEKMTLIHYKLQKSKGKGKKRFKESVEDNLINSLLNLYKS